MTTRPTVLVPIRVLEGESIPEGTPELLANAHVVLLGYHEVPDQTAPGQARMQFEDRSDQQLEEFEALLTDAGATVDTRLVFTHEGQKTIDRLIYEYECLAVLVPHATRSPERVLVPIRGTVGIDRIVQVVSGLFAGTGVAITLFHVAAKDETDEDVETFLDGIGDRLSHAGIPDESISIQVARDRRPQDAIAGVAAEFDVIVMGESDPSFVTYVFGMHAKQVVDRFLGPVLVVQREKPSDQEPQKAVE